MSSFIDCIYNKASFGEKPNGQNEMCGAAANILYIYIYIYIYIYYKDMLYSHVTSNYDVQERYRTPIQEIARLLEYHIGCNRMAKKWLIGESRNRQPNPARICARLQRRALSYPDS